MSHLSNRAKGHEASIEISLTSDNEVLAAWRIGAIRSCSVAETGTIHRTLLVSAEAGNFALRGYRHSLRSRVDARPVLPYHSLPTTKGIMKHIHPGSHEVTAGC